MICIKCWIYLLKKIRSPKSTRIPVDQGIVIYECLLEIKIASSNLIFRTTQWHRVTLILCTWMSPVSDYFLILFASLFNRLRNKMKKAGLLFPPMCHSEVKFDSLFSLAYSWASLPLSLLSSFCPSFS